MKKSCINLGSIFRRYWAFSLPSIFRLHLFNFLLPDITRTKYSTGTIYFHRYLYAATLSDTSNLQQIQESSTIFAGSECIHQLSNPLNLHAKIVQRPNRCAVLLRRSQSISRQKMDSWKCVIQSGGWNKNEHSPVCSSYFAILLD